MLETLLRLLVTLVGAAVPTMLLYVPLPGLDTEAFDVPSLAMGGLGLDAVLIAFVCVELAALAVPRWRPLRHDHHGRVRLLRATILAATPLVILQAILVAWFLRGSEMLTPGLGSILLDAAVFVAGTLVLVGAARAVSRWGTGHGLSVVVVLGTLPRWLEMVDPTGALEPEVGVRTLVFAALGALFLVGREVRGVRLPMVGLVPLLVPAWICQLAMLVQLVVAVDLGALVGVSALTVAIVAAIVTLALVWATHRTVAAWRAHGAAIALSILVTSAIATGDETLRLDNGLVGANGGLAYFVTTVVVLMDVLREASLRMRMRVVPVLAFDDVVAADRAGTRLAEADIAFVLRGIGHRTLLRWFGPWVPVRLFVDAGRTEEAAAIARAEAHRDAHADIARFF